MRRPITLSSALALALSLVALPLPAQSRPLTPQEVAGCYGLTRGPWSRPLEGDPRYHALPDTVRLDTLPAEPRHRLAERPAVPGNAAVAREGRQR